MRIFITGSSGQLGKSLVAAKIRGEVYLATKKDLDIVDEKKVMDQITRFKPDVVIHLASLTRGDECAKNPKLARAINVLGTKNVIQACLKNNSTLVFVSTNEVFDGKKNKPYKETDTPNPITVVGKTKYEAEKLITSRMEKYFIIRTSWLFGEWAQNFLYAILKKASENKDLEIVEDEVSSPTYSMDLARAIKKIIYKKKYGIYHITNNGKASRLEFAKKSFKICNFNEVNIYPIKLKKYKRISRPPLFTPLNNTKASSIGIKMPSWEISLQKFLKNYKI